MVQMEYSRMVKPRNTEVKTLKNTERRINIKINRYLQANRASTSSRTSLPENNGVWQTDTKK